jgi:hypothetical protein
MTCSTLFSEHPSDRVSHHMGRLDAAMSFVVK